MRRRFKFRTRRGGRFILVAGLLISLSLGTYSASAGRQAAGKSVPNLELPTLQGKSISLKSLRGKVVFLNFWASWCPSCRMEMPTLEKIHKRFNDRDLAVVAVSIDAGGKKSVLPLLKKLGLTFPVPIDPNQKVMDRYGVTLIPTAFIIGRNGEIIGKAIGPKDWDGENGRRILEKLLDVSRAASSSGSHSALQR